MVDLIALLLFLLPLAYSPGPGNLFFAALAAHAGTRAVMPALIGYHLATLLVTILIGVGLLQSLQAHPTAAKIIGILGSFYVLFLAYRFFTAPTAKLSAEAQDIRTASFVDGAVLLVLNPKAYMIIVLMFTQFNPAKINPAAPFIGALSIAVIFTLNNLFAFSLWSFLGNVLMRRFRHGPHRKLANCFFGLLLASIAIWMLVSNMQG